MTVRVRDVCLDVEGDDDEVELVVGMEGEGEIRCSVQFL
jgi:hypothetical protein